MPGFKFRLQTVLNIKMQKENSLKNELGKAMQRLEVEKKNLSSIIIEMENCIDNFNSESSKGVTVDRLREFSAYIPVLKEHVQIQKERVKYAEQDVDNIRVILIKAVQEREILDKLKEKQYKEYMEEQVKKEQKVVDEIVSYKYSKNDQGD
jgi:flagellar FliJ protein